MVASRTQIVGQLVKRLNFGTHEHEGKCHGDRTCLHSVVKEERTKKSIFLKVVARLLPSSGYATVCCCSSESFVYIRIILTFC
jgi:hypothetical protein